MFEEAFVLKIGVFSFGVMPFDGVSTFCVETANEFVRRGNTCVVYSIYKDPKPQFLPDIRLRMIDRAVQVGEEHLDIASINAIWHAWNIDVMRWCWRRRIPYVVSPHGGLMPRVFTKGRIRKWLVWHFVLKPLVRRAAAIHCTSSAEVEACKALGLKGPFVVAPLGVHLPDCPNCGDSSPSQTRTVLFLGRISEEKGLLGLLDAWRSLRREGWVLKISGPDWRHYRQLLEQKIANEHIAGVELLGTADAAAKDLLYREADIFVLPSPMENFSMVVLEALAYGVPAIATKGTPWAELESERCGLWIEQGVEPLCTALQKMMELSDAERAEMGARGRRLAATRYQWPAVAKKLLDCYNAVVG